MEELSQWFERRLAKTLGGLRRPGRRLVKTPRKKHRNISHLRDQYSFDVDYLFMSDMSSKLRVKSRIAAVRIFAADMRGEKTPYLAVVNVKECPTLMRQWRKYRWKIDRTQTDI